LTGKKGAKSKTGFGCVNARMSLIYVPVPNQTLGRQIAEELVKRKLAGCVNIIPVIESIYWWDSKVENEQESVLIIKTLPDKVTELTETISQMHPYEVPVIIGIPVASVNSPYMHWLNEVLIQE
jgi:periplasmic divalent cation tolerance protein